MSSMSRLKQERDGHSDLSHDLQDKQEWNPGILRDLEYVLDPVAFSIDPVFGLFVVGTSRGLIYIFGAPAVELRLKLPSAIRVKALQIAVYVSKLICVDSNDTLYVWDLSAPGRPELVSSTSFGSSVNSVALSPSHSHAFIALESGTIQTYDLMCSCESPYALPNMWTLYQRDQYEMDVRPQSNPGSNIPMEVVIHPRDLNLIFVAYGGGVALCDLTKRSLIRMYELVLTPGAPGGTGYNHHDLLTDRRPPVTAFAIHPAGHFFATGHDDGCIAVWAVEDEDKPLLVRTLDDLDVNAAKGEELAQALEQIKNGQTPSVPRQIREPIFKLLWSGFPNSSDPRGGETALTILGGTLGEDVSGVTVQWLPAFNPSASPPVSSSSHPNPRLDPFLRKAMRDSLAPINTYFYATPGPTQDVLLVPRDSPHFSGTWDPISILLMYESEEGTRAVEGYEFPPPAFSAKPDRETGRVDSSDEFSNNLASVMESLRLDTDPAMLHLPPSLCSGANAIIGGSLVQLGRDAYNILTGAEDPSDGLKLRGGIAVAGSTSTNSANLRIAKYQPKRLLITHHRNLNVRVQDVSAQLLAGSESEPLQRGFPHVLSGLTIDVVPALTELSLEKRESAMDLNESRIQSVHMATESLECAVVMQSGTVIVYRFSADPRPGSVMKTSHDEELLSLEHLSGRKCSFHPTVLIQATAPVTGCELSDVGFLAVAYADGALIAVDLRQPRVLLHDIVPVKAKKRRSLATHLYSHDETDPVCSVSWIVGSLSSDLKPTLRLITVKRSGAAKIFSLSHSSSSGLWTVDKEPKITEVHAKVLSPGSFVVNAKTGSLCRANKISLAACMNQTSGTSSGAAHCLWVTASAKGLRCVLDFDGEKVGKADWDSKMGVVEYVDIVERNGWHAVVAFTNKSEAILYSLPELKQLHVLQLPKIPGAALSADGTGDYVAWSCDRSGFMSGASLRTLFDFHRAYAHPDVDLSSTKGAIPSQPQPVSPSPPSMLDSLFKFGQGTTGEQIDALLAGPDRPLPKRMKPTSESVKSLSVQSKRSSSPASQTSARSEQESLYSRLTSSLAERGEALGQLQENFNSLEEGSREMVAQAKRLAAEQAGKRWFNF